MRAIVVLLTLLALPAVARPRVRQPCASDGFSCKPGPCCQGTKCADDGVCRKPEKDWSEGRNPAEPGPDDKPKAPKKPR